MRTDGMFLPAKNYKPELKNEMYYAESDVIESFKRVREDERLRMASNSVEEFDLLKHCEDYVEKWINSHESETFQKSDIKNEGYWYTSKNGYSSINLSIFFANLLEDYISEHNLIPSVKTEEVKSDAVEFGNWLSKNHWHPCGFGELIQWQKLTPQSFSKFAEPPQFKSTEELYSLFLNQQSK